MKFEEQGREGGQCICYCRDNAMVLIGGVGVGAWVGVDLCKDKGQVEGKVG